MAALRDTNWRDAYRRWNDARRRLFFRWTLKRRQGGLFLLDRSSGLDRHVIKRGSWEAEQIAMLESLARAAKRAGQRAIFLDVGSYFGLYALHMARTGLFDEVHAFEANPVNFAQLQATLLLNEAVGAIDAKLCAVGDRRGTIRVAPPNRRDRGASPIDAPGEGGFTVDAIALDDHFGGRAGELIVVKIDVEGHEAAVLRGMGEMAKNGTIVLQIEILRESAGTTRADLAALGFTVVAERYPDVWLRKD